MAYIVTDLVERQVQRLFKPEDVALVIGELQTRKLPLVNEGSAPERIHLAILHLSEGDLRSFDEAMRLAILDWRDLLCAAGLENADWPAVLRSRGIDFR